MPYIKFIIIPLMLTNFSFAESEIINPFANPSVIQGNSQEMETQSTYEEETTLSPSSSSDIINPFKDPHLIQGDSTEEEYQEEKNILPSLSTNDVIQSDVINPFDDQNIIQEEPQTTYQKEESLYSQSTPNIPAPDTQTAPLVNGQNTTFINSITPNIQGNYRFIEGIKSYGAINKKIESGFLVIEKLDENNYGFYYTFKVETFSPDNYFGIFRYKKGKFYQRVIKNEGSMVTEDLENTTIITGDNKLELSVKTQNGGRIMIWELDNYATKPDAPKLQHSLDDAKRSYIQVYKQKFSQLN